MQLPETHAQVMTRPVEYRVQAISLLTLERGGINDEFPGTDRLDDFCLEDRPVDQPRQLYQRMGHVDDLIKTVMEQICALRRRFFGLHRRKNLQETARILIDFMHCGCSENKESNGSYNVAIRRTKNATDTQGNL